MLMHLMPRVANRVIPAKAGIQEVLLTASDSALDSRLRGNDGSGNPKKEKGGQWPPCGAIIDQAAAAAGEITSPSISGTRSSPASPASMWTVWPSCTSPARIASASRSCTSRWMTRFSGRAP